MTYFDPLLDELTAARQWRSPIGQYGQQLAQANIPVMQGGGFWKNLAAQIVPDLIGAGLTHMGQQQEHARRTQTGALILEALKQPNTNAQAAYFETHGRPDLAGSFLMAQKEQEMQRLADLQAYKDQYAVAQPERDRAHEISLGNLNISRAQLGIQQRNASIAERKMQVEEALARQAQEMRALVDKGELSREGFKEMVSLSDKVAKDPLVSQAADATNRVEKFGALLKLTDPKERAAASAILLPTFAKLPNEAFMSDDARRVVDTVGYPGGFEAFIQQLTGTGGALPESSFVPMYRVLKLVAEDAQARRNIHIAQTYAPQAQGIINAYKSPYDPSRQLVSSDSFQALLQRKAFEDIKELPSASNTKKTVNKPVKSHTGTFEDIAAEIYHNLFGGK